MLKTQCRKDKTILTVGVPANANDVVGGETVSMLVSGT